MIIHILVSLEHISAGYLSALLIGFVIGVYIFTGAGKVFVLFFDGLRSVPAIALFPVFIYTVGNGFGAKSLVIFWTSFPVFALGVAAALYGVDREIMEAGMLDGLTARDSLFKVGLPASYPSIILAARSAFGGALISVTAAEMLGSSKGIGFYIMAMSQTFQFMNMFAGILALAVIGITVNKLFSKIHERMTDEKE